MAAGGHFGWPKITFNHICHYFRSIHNFNFFGFVFTKWHLAAILDDRKSLSIAFLAISDQYATFILFLFFHKMAAGGHFGWPKITFDRITRHFRSISNFNFFDFFFTKCGGHFGWPKITFNRISRHFRSICNILDYLKSIFIIFLHKMAKWLSAILDDWKSLLIAFLDLPFIFCIFFYKMAAGDHFGWPKIIAFLAISDQYTTIIFWIFFTKWPLAAILDDWKSLLIAFLAISYQYATFVFDFFFATKWPLAAILDDRKWLLIAFLAISDQYTTLIYLDFFHKMAFGGHFGWPKITFDRISRHFRSIRNFFFFHKMAAVGHFVWPKITFDRITRHFRSISNFNFFDFFLQNVAAILNDQNHF